MRIVLVLCLLLVSHAPALCAVAADAYRALGIDTAAVLSGTSTTAKVVPGASKQFISVTSYMTGKRSEADAVEVRLDIFQTVDGKLVPIYQRAFGAERGGYVAEGNLQVIDLDMDGVAEIVVSYESFASPVIAERVAEVLVYGEDGFEVAWSGPIRYDATKAVRDVPRERRDSFRRDLDLGKTMATRGAELHWNKRMTAIAGETLADPRLVDEVFPFRTVER